MYNINNLNNFCEEVLLSLLEKKPEMNTNIGMWKQYTIFTKALMLGFVLSSKKWVRTTKKISRHLILSI